jgi:hypothetical protein
MLTPRAKKKRQLFSPLTPAVIDISHYFKKLIKESEINFPKEIQATRNLFTK